jgi:catechol 2,3-dioxygenase-like lactoylglutathione lyase family enzyme
MDWKLEVVVVPVSDIDRAKEFYEGQCGFNADVDYSPNEHFRVVQLTPPGSACSITIGKGLAAMEPGSLQGLQITVSDVAAARAELVARGVDVSPIQHFEDGQMADGPGGDFNTFIFFSDPDGNGWSIQQHDPAAAGSGSPLLPVE